MPPKKDGPKKDGKKKIVKKKSAARRSGSFSDVSTGRKTPDSGTSTPLRPSTPVAPAVEPPTKGCCLVLSCIDKTNRKVFSDTDVIENMWFDLGFTPYVHHNVSAKAVHNIIQPYITERVNDKRSTPECMIIALQVEERDGQMTDRNGMPLDLVETFNFLSNTEGLDAIPKMLYLHVYKLDKDNEFIGDSPVERSSQQSVILPAVKNLVLYHYIDHEDRNRLEEITMAVILSDVFLRNTRDGPFDVVDSLNQVTYQLPRPKRPNYYWRGPVRTVTLYQPLVLQKS